MSVKLVKILAQAGVLVVLPQNNNRRSAYFFFCWSNFRATLFLDFNKFDL